MTLVLVTSPVATMAGFEPVHPFVRAFLRELRDRGYVEGKNLIFERRSPEGYAACIPAVPFCSQLAAIFTSERV